MQTVDSVQVPDFTDNLDGKRHSVRAEAGNASLTSNNASSIPYTSTWLKRFTNTNHRVPCDKCLQVFLPPTRCTLWLGGKNHISQVSRRIVNFDPGRIWKGETKFCENFSRFIYSSGTETATLIPRGTQTQNAYWITTIVNMYRYTTLRSIIVDLHNVHTTKLCTPMFFADGKTFSTTTNFVGALLLLPSSPNSSNAALASSRSRVLNSESVHARAIIRGPVRKWLIELLKETANDLHDSFQLVPKH